MSDVLIRFEEVRKAFGSQTVLDGVNLTLEKGRITTIIGLSGGGKSVLIKHIVGLLTPDSGRILYQAQDISSLSRAEYQALKSKFSFMFQGMALFDSMTVLENVALPLQERTRMTWPKIRQEVLDILSILDLHNIINKYPGQISGGMRKRVALARALITKPEIVMFDEPDTGLDPVRKKAVHDMIFDFQRKFGYTAVIVSHELPDILRISDRVAMLHQGKIAFEGTREEFDNTTSAVVRDFLAGVAGESQETQVLEEVNQGGF